MAEWFGDVPVSRPYERGRHEAALLHRGHALESLLTAANVQQGGRIREPRSAHPIGFPGSHPTVPRRTLPRRFSGAARTGLEPARCGAGRGRRGGRALRRHLPHRQACARPGRAAERRLSRGPSLPIFESASKNGELGRSLATHDVRVGTYLLICNQLGHVAGGCTDS